MRELFDAEGYECSLDYLYFNQDRFRSAQVELVVVNWFPKVRASSTTSTAASPMAPIAALPGDEPGGENRHFAGFQEEGNSQGPVLLPRFVTAKAGNHAYIPFGAGANVIPSAESDKTFEQAAAL